MKIRIGAVLMMMSLCAPVWIHARPLSLEPGSTLSLSGDSTLHPFISTATVLKVTAEADSPPGTDLIPAIMQKKALQKWDLVIPVKGLKSKESGLDKNLYKALKAEEYPDIIFKMTNYEVHPSTLQAGGFQVNASGVLTIAGKEQPVQLLLEALEEGTILCVQGRHTLLMTDYGIKPPSLMMGAIKVKNPVQIRFNLCVR